MAKRGSYSLGEYQGSYSSLDPNKAYGTDFTGYRTKASLMGASTRPDTANQIQEVNQLLNQGMVPIEVGVLKPEAFDQIPKEHFKELNRMSKLTGSKLSIHAPLIETSGITEQGWSEANRELAERQLKEVVDKSYNVSDKERVPITIHPSSMLAGSEWVPTEGGGEEGKKEREKIIAVDQETGKQVPIERETKYYPGSEKLEKEEKGEKFDPERKLRSQNFSEWDNNLNQLFFNKDRVDEIIKKQGPHIQKALEVLRETPEKDRQMVLKERGDIKQGYEALQSAETYLDDLQNQLASNFNRAWKYCKNDEEKERLKEFSKKFRENIEGDPSLKGQSQAIQNFLFDLKKVVPQKYVTVEDFAKQHSSKTFGNVALNAYKKYGEKAPMINIENMYTGMAFSGSMDDMNELIKESKQQFVKNAMKPKNQGGLGLKEDKAKKAADDVIGMTLDMGHLNIAKKKGFSDKYLSEEAKKVADQVKHVHMADNFGYSDSHLPPGMGNVPNKEILEELEKKGKTKELRKIVEAGGFVQNFGVSPHPYSLEGMGAPFYQEGEPYWNQAVGFQQGYGEGFGQMLPSGHFETYGIPSFSNLPSELGGQRMGAGGSRVSGKPME